MLFPKKKQLIWQMWASPQQEHLSQSARSLQIRVEVVFMASPGRVCPKF